MDQDVRLVGEGFGAVGGEVAGIVAGAGEAVAGEGEELIVGGGEVGEGLPGVAAHHEEAQGVVGEEAGVFAFEEVVKPANLQCIDGVVGGGAIVAIADPPPPGEMTPRADQEILGGLALRSHLPIEAQIAPQVGIKPAANVEHRQIHFAQLGLKSVPIVIVMGMVEPFKIERRIFLEAFVKMGRGVGDGQLPRRLIEGFKGGLIPLAAGGFGGELHGPA